MVANTLTWGDTVIIKRTAPKKFQPSCVGSICGIREVETLMESQKYGCSIGDNLYLVEFSDGNSLEISGNFLLKYF